MNVHTWEAVRYSVCVGVTVALDKEIGKRKEGGREREREKAIKREGLTIHMRKDTEANTAANMRRKQEATSLVL